MDDFNKATDTSTASSSIWNSAQFCGYRLPCGYCTRLGQPCPMYCTNTITPTPTWRLPDITCQAKEET